MSVDRIDYLFWGVKVPGDFEFDYDDFEAECDGAEGAKFRIISDHMNSDYVMIGAVLAESCKWDGFEFVDVETAMQGLDRTSVQDVVVAAFPSIARDDFKMYLFTDYT